MTRSYWFVMAVLSVLVLFGNTGCLPDNFWSDKWGELINRGIFGVINAALGNGLAL